MHRGGVVAWLASAGAPACVAVAILTGCAGSGARPPAASGAAPDSGDAARRGAPPATTPEHAREILMPLLVDRTDLRIGTSVYFNRLPTDADLNDLRLVRGVTHVVVVLNDWPTEPTSIEPLARVPEESDCVVILAGYPPTRSASDLWNYISNPQLSLVLLVTGPPTNRLTIDDLNAMRSLSRVIVEMDDPSRSGFERLQRPLSFRKVVR